VEKSFDRKPAPIEVIVKTGYKWLSLGHSDALPHRESNQGIATFRLLAWRFAD